MTLKAAAVGLTESALYRYCPSKEALYSAIEIIDTSIVNVAIPSMMGTLGATLDEIDWVITSYIIANVVIIPLTG